MSNEKNGSRQMTNVEFKSLLNLVMCSDPSPVSAEEDAAIRAWLDDESRARGFADWIEAFHRVEA